MAINHFTHPYPQHNLQRTNTGPDEFTCGACKSLGTGDAYKCENLTCKFTLHVICASISDEQSVSFFLHPKHNLGLLTEGSHQKMKKPVVCKLCEEQVHGMWYRCAACNFDVHPICAHLPLLHTDRAHPGHEMGLHAGSILSRCSCSRCGERCKQCHYRCTKCDFVSHLECLLDTSGSIFCYKVAHKITRPSPISEPILSDGDKAKEAHDSQVLHTTLGIAEVAAEAFEAASAFGATIN